MKILWVKAGKLLPVDTGGKIRSYNLLRQLAARHEVTLLTYHGGARDETYEREIAERLPGAEAIHTAAPASTFAQALDYLRRLPARAPYAVAKFTSPRVARRVGELLDAQSFDAAVCDFLSASLNFPRELRTPTALFQHNVESALWRRQARHEPHPLRRAAFEIEAAKMSAYERAAVARFHHVVAVSEHDRALMSEMTDPSRITVVPTGVDLAQYRATDAGEAARGDAEQQPLVLFLGSMDWEANVDGVEWFVREVWAQISSAIPGARFRVVGRDPAPRVRRLASASVEITGTVPSVVEHLREATVFVVPLRVGGGTRLKIFEAMAAGKAVVSTTVGAEGLDVTDGRDVILADDARAFADSVVGLLRDGARRREFEQAASALAARHDWSAVVRRFEDALESAISFASQARAGGEEENNEGAARLTARV
ncbi:MAG: glycosyltransferase family 4 protein [Acidobacteria bacterium]|nr:glycosyltransferase family 4 protein [Acidobacteriota bacterium]